MLTWLEADPAHESELAKVQRQHDLVALSAPVINELYAKDRRRRFGSVLRRWSATAAAVVLLAFGGYYFHAARDFSRQGERLLSVSVPYGQRVSLTLQDGTSVWLNAGTTLRYPALFTGRERRVEIEGEARFEVVHDAKHPFIVRTYACDVEVLGTKFNVAADEAAREFSTALLRGCDLLGRAKSYDMAVLEVDERASVRIFPYVKPDYAVVTNLTRDSIMRNAHPGYIADILTRSIPQTATMILNADDLITCGVAPENRRVYFGVDRLPGDTTRCENLIDDLRICPKCSGKLTYVYRRYHHIGKCVCPDCGFRSPESDYLATDVDMEKGTMALREGGEEHPYRLISDSVPNLYNMVTVIAVLRQLGYSHEAISGYMSRAAVVATRHMEEQVGNVKLVRQMSKEKNALAGSRTFQYIAQRPGTKELLLMMNCLGDAHHWSENTCWIFDADFEYLRNDSVVQLVCTGARCRDYKLRLLMAGVPQERIVCEPDEFRAAELLRYTPGDDVYILYGTDSLALSYKVYDHMKEEAARRTQGGAEKEGQA